jgi:hypothetical protein
MVEVCQETEKNNMRKFAVWGTHSSSTLEPRENAGPPALKIETPAPSNAVRIGQAAMDTRARGRRLAGPGLMLLLVLCGCANTRFRTASFPNENNPEFRDKGYTNETSFHKDIYAPERVFNHGDTNAPPFIGLAVSGGGPRAGAFTVGVFKGLYDHGILTNVDVISAVSGGSYALSWLLLQPYYHKTLLNSNVPDTMAQMFQRDGRFIKHIESASEDNDWLTDIQEILINSAVGLGFYVPNGIDKILSKWAGQPIPEKISNNSMDRLDYKRMIEDIYQVVPQPDNQKKPIKFYSGSWFGSDAGDSDIRPGMRVNFQEMKTFALANHLPDFIFNSTLYTEPGRTNSQWTNWMASSLWQSNFQATPFGFGSDSFGYRRWNELDGTNYFIGSLNLASAIAGAAICTHNNKFLNFQFSKLPLTVEIGLLASWSFSRALHIFDADLAYDIHLPTNGIPTAPKVIHLSDGGHSENLGVYALVQRRCQNIIVVDAEQEMAENFIFESYYHLKRVLKSEMDLTLTVPDIENGTFTKTNAANPVMEGTISGFTDPSTNTLLHIYYIKLSLDARQLANYPASVTNAGSSWDFNHPLPHHKFPYVATLDFTLSSNIVSGLIDLGDYTVAHSLMTNFMQTVKGPAPVQPLAQLQKQAIQN